MKTLNEKTEWLVEEIDYHTGEVKFKQKFSTYDEAVQTYTEKKRSNMLNTVSIEKVDKRLLLE